MRKFMIGAATAAALAAIPTAANAQAATTTGVVVGAGTGFAIGGPPGAVIGGVIGGSVGAAHEPHVVYVEPRARVSTRVYAQPTRQVCWRDAWNRTFCEYR